jgi:hypothetical protein
MCVRPLNVELLVAQLGLKEYQRHLLQVEGVPWTADQPAAGSIINRA